MQEGWRRELWCLAVGIRQRKRQDNSQISDLDNCVVIISINERLHAEVLVRNKDSNLFDTFGLINLWNRLICQIICSTLNLDRLLPLSQSVER